MHYLCLKIIQRTFHTLSIPLSIFFNLIHPLHIHSLARFRLLQVSLMFIWWLHIFIIIGWSRLFLPLLIEFRVIDRPKFYFTEVVELWCHSWWWRMQLPDIVLRPRFLQGSFNKTFLRRPLFSLHIKNLLISIIFILWPIIVDVTPQDFYFLLLFLLVVKRQVIIVWIKELRWEHQRRLLCLSVSFSWLLNHLVITISSWVCTSAFAYTFFLCFWHVFPLSSDIPTLSKRADWLLFGLEYLHLLLIFENL